MHPCGYEILQKFSGKRIFFDNLLKKFRGLIIMGGKWSKYKCALCKLVPKYKKDENGNWFCNLCIKHTEVYYHIKLVERLLEEEKQRSLAKKSLGS